jgi:flagellar motility protein MotE (MotC chaperone)
MALGCIKLALAGAYLYFQAVPDAAIPVVAAAASRGGTTSGYDAPVPGGDGDCQPELLSVITARARELEKRKMELDRRQRDLDLLQSDIETMLEELKKLQARLGSPVKKARKDSEIRFQHLVGVYSSMEPGRAAALLGKMDEKTVTRIFASMKSKKVAAIMALMDPETAASISSQLTRMGK